MGTYKIISHNGAGLPLNVYGNGTITDRRNVCIWNQTDSNDQRWSINSLANNQLVRSMNNTNYALNAFRSNWNCDVYTVNRDSYVNFIALGNNLYRIQLKSDTSKYLATTGTASNSNVNWQAYNSSSTSQQWQVTLVGSITPPSEGSRILTMPSGRNCNWNQKHIGVTKLFGRSACTLVSGLNAANFYSTNANGYTPSDMSPYWTSAGYTWGLPGQGKIGRKVCENASKARCLAQIKSEINCGHPVLVNLGSASANHTVFAYGYVNGAADYSDILAHDPANMTTGNINGRAVDLANAMSYSKKTSIWSLRPTYQS